MSHEAYLLEISKHGNTANKWTGQTLYKALKRTTGYCWASGMFLG